MDFFRKVIIFLAGCNIILAKSYYDYDYEPHRSFHLPWAIKYPQPIISIDGSWPIGSPPGLYPYPLSRDEDYLYQETNYQQELLIKSLNKALTKINQLLPPMNLNFEETTPYPAVTKPEVLADALNKAIDKLGVLLTKQALPLKNPETVSTETTVHNKPEITSEKIYDSVNSAIDDLNKLFATLPEELKANPKPLPVDMKNNMDKPAIFEFHPMKPGYISGPFYPEPNQMNIAINEKQVTSEKPSLPFTSKIMTEQNEVTEIIEENNISPITSNSVSNSGIVSENTLFTSSILPTENNIDTSTVIPTENNTVTTNMVDSTDVSTKIVETELTTIKNVIAQTTTITPNIDIRFGEDQNSDMIIFPDEFEEMQKPLMNKEIIELASRFKENKTVNTVNVQQKSSTPITLEYKPSRPPFHADIFPPLPPVPSQPVTFRPSTIMNLDDRNKQTTQKPFNQNTPIVLGYKPSRPPIEPNPVFYPSQILTSSTERSATQTFVPDLGDRNKIPITTTQKTITTKKPTDTTTRNNRPYHPTHYYSTPLSLEYKPTRPFYAPNPVVYPKPIIPPGTPWPASSTQRSEN